MALTCELASASQLILSLFNKFWMTGAMLMAWYFNGMSARELATLIDSMTHSGR